MIKIKPHLKNLYRTNPDEKSRKGYLRLDMNESISGLPEVFLKKVLLKIDHEFLATYPQYNEIREKIAFHNNLKPENICLANGSDAAIKYIFDAYISARDRILLTDPTFAMYTVYSEMFAAEPIIIEYKSDLSFPGEDFIKRISNEIKIAVVVNPNNPTGSIVEKDTLIRIIERAAKNNVLIIVDEAYFYFYPESVIGEVKHYKNLIVLRTFSKLCGMASLRLGYAASSPEIIEDLIKVRPTYDVNGLATLLAKELLDKPDIIQSLIKSTNEGKQYLAKKLSEEAIEYKEGYANFVLIKCDGRADKIMARLAKKKILVGGRFKQNFLKDYIRVTVGNKIFMEQFWKNFIDVWKIRDD